MVLADHQGQQNTGAADCTVCNKRNTNAGGSKPDTNRVVHHHQFPIITSHRFVKFDEQQLTHSNYGARELESGRLHSALSHLRKAVHFFAPLLEEDNACDELDLSKFRRSPETTDNPSVSTVFMWAGHSSFSQTTQQGKQERGHSSDLHVFTRPALILPTTEQEPDELGMAAVMIYNLGLCHHSLALAIEQGTEGKTPTATEEFGVCAAGPTTADHYQIAARCYKTCVRLLYHCPTDLCRALLIATKNNLGCLSVQLGHIFQGTHFFQEVLYEMTVMEMMRMNFYEIFGAHDATGITLNTLYESTTAKMA